MEPPTGINKYKNTQKKLFEPEVIKWYMPVAVGGKHEMEVEVKSKWEKSLLQIKNATDIHNHLH